MQFFYGRNGVVKSREVRTIKGEEKEKKKEKEKNVILTRKKIFNYLSFSTYDAAFRFYMQLQIEKINEKLPSYFKRKERNTRDRIKFQTNRLCLL